MWLVRSPARPGPSMSTSSTASRTGSGGPSRWAAPVCVALRPGSLVTTPSRSSPACSWCSSRTAATRRGSSDDDPRPLAPRRHPARRPHSALPLPARRARGQAGRDHDHRRRARRVALDALAVPRRRGGFPADRTCRLAAEPRDHLLPGRRRDLRTARPDDDAADLHLRPVLERRRDQDAGHGVHGLIPPARDRHGRGLHRARPFPLLCVLRADAPADVLDHRGVGWPAAHLLDPQVRSVHPCGVAPHARGHRRRLPGVRRCIGRAHAVAARPHRGSRPLLILLSVVAIVYGAIVSAVQKDLKKLVAYSSVAHMGFVTLGIFVLNLQGGVGAVLQMLNHGFVTGALFLFVGIQYEKTHRRMIADLGGLANMWPVFTTFFGIFVLASLGLPGLNGFVGEFLVLLGTFKFGGVPLGGLFWGPLSAIGVILAAVYLLWMFQRVMYGPVREAYRALPDLSRLEIACALPLVLLTVILGVVPQPFIAYIEPSVDRLVRLATDPSFVVVAFK